MAEYKPSENTRFRLLHDTAVFQIKLLADGFRDAMLIPVSLIAAVIGFLRGGDEPDREFKRVLDLGRQTERWINLFGRHDDVDIDHSAGTIDKVLEQAEAAVVEQYKKGRRAADETESEKSPQTPASEQENQ